MAVSLRLDLNQVIEQRGNKIDVVLPKLEYKKGLLSQSNEPAQFINSRLIKVAEGVLFFINNGQPLVNENLKLTTFGKDIAVVSYHANGNRTYLNTQTEVQAHQFYLSKFSLDTVASSIFLPGPHLNFSFLISPTGARSLSAMGVLTEQQLQDLMALLVGDTHLAKAVTFSAKSNMLAKLTLSRLAKNNNSMLLTSCIYELLNSLAQDLSQPVIQSNESKCLIAKECSELISFHGSKRITISEIAETLFCNENHLSRAFKDFYGVSVREYLFQQRMLLARNLIKKYYYTPKQVAEFLGYSDISSFSRAYRRYLN